MVSKLLFFVSFLLVIVFAKAEDDWSCETFNGTPCSGSTSIMVADVGREDPHLNVSSDVTCTGRNKQESNTFTASVTTTFMENVTMEEECLVKSTPCITDFSLCITDFNVPPVTLKCSYLKDFEPVENEVASSGNETTKCGTRAAKENTYLLNTARGTTTIKYNCEMLYISKPITHVESTTTHSENS